MSTSFAGRTLPFATSFTLQSIVSGLSNLVAQYNFSSITPIVLIFDRIYSDTPNWALTAMSCSVFGGAVVGMLTLGYLGDAIGRKRAMMVTLTIMCAGAFGSCLFTWGRADDIYVLITIWRFVMGIGIGGVYPLSASSSYENDEGAAGSYEQRLRNVAWTQAWQQPGQMLPFLVALVTLGIFHHHHDDWSTQFRIILVVGALLALGPFFQLRGDPDLSNELDSEERFLSIPVLIGKVNAKKEGWRLVGVCACWFCSDFFSYGTSLYGPELLEKIYNEDLDLIKNYRFNVASVAATFPTPPGCPSSSWAACPPSTCSSSAFWSTRWSFSWWHSTGASTRMPSR